MCITSQLYMSCNVLYCLVCQELESSCQLSMSVADIEGLHYNIVGMHSPEPPPPPPPLNIVISNEHVSCFHFMNMCHVFIL